MNADGREWPRMKKANLDLFKKALPLFLSALICDHLRSSAFSGSQLLRSVSVNQWSKLNEPHNLRLAEWSRRNAELLQATHVAKVRAFPASLAGRAANIDIAWLRYMISLWYARR